MLQLAPRVLALARLKLSSTVSVGRGPTMLSVSVALLLPVDGSCDRLPAPSPLPCSTPTTLRWR